MLRVDIPKLSGEHVSRLILRLLLPPGIQTCIDLMSGDGKWPRETLVGAKLTLVDIEPKQLPLRVPGVTALALDVRQDHEVFDLKYDAALCLDGIEHVSKSSGWFLLERMLHMAPRCIVFTPYKLGAQLDEPHSKDPHSHKCEWEPEDVPDWASIVLPDFHKPHWSGGAFWFWTCPGLKEDFMRVVRGMDECGLLRTADEKFRRPEGSP